jgi:hypothetical protein
MIVYHDFGWTQNFAPVAVARLDHFQDNMIRFLVVLPRPNRLMNMWIKGLANAVLRFDPVYSQEAIQLLQGHIHSFQHGILGSRLPATDRAF